MTGVELSEPRLLRDRAYIDGRWVGAAGTLAVFNPADESQVGLAPDLGAEATEKAVAAAHAALPAWRGLTGKARGEVLRRWRDLMLIHQEDLARLMTAEQGKPLGEARAEVTYAAAFLEWFAEEARRVEGGVLTPHQADRRLVVLRHPVGVVAAVTPWNFPLAMITRKAGPALAVGCTLVVKPSELTPLSALALASLGEQAGLPPGVLNVVTGQAAPIGEVLTSDPRVRKFTFTGSTAIGKMLAARCMGSVKRLSLELGGNAPFIVFDDADLDRAVEGAIASKYRNAGQTCVCANRFLIQAGVYEAFSNRLSERVARMRVGPGLSGDVDMGPLVDRRAVDRVGRHVEDALARGAHLVLGGKAVEGRGCFFLPTVLTDVPLDALLCRDETFGPVAALTCFDRETEALEMANHTSAGLAAYVFTSDLDRSWRMSEALHYGMVGLNTGLISTEVAPFGGVKESGLGREGSRYGVDDYLDMKLVCTALSGPPADPPTCA